MQRPTVYSISREIITCIGLHLLHCKDVLPARKALITLATTCRYLSEPLLDVIWYELVDVIPLLLLLPTDLCTTAMEKTPLEPWYKPRKEFVLLRDPVPEDFKRMHVYSSRVKVIQSLKGSVAKFRQRDYKISPHIWDMLAQYGPKPLLANLRKLHCTPARPCYDVEKCLAYHDQAFHDWFENLDFSLGICSSPSSGNEVVMGITRFAPHIKELRWFGHHFYIPWIIEGTEICHLSSLRKLQASDVAAAPDTLRAIGTLPKLRELEVRADFFKPEWEESSVFPHGHFAGLFPVLERLDLNAAGPLGTVALMETITSPSLTHLAIQLKNRKTPDLQLDALFLTISTSPFQGALRSLELVIPPDGWLIMGFPRCYPITSACLRPLLSLRQLDTLRFKADFPMLFIDDTFIDEMSCAWPDVRILQFGTGKLVSDSVGQYSPDPHVGDPDCPRATLAGLVPLAIRCPCLEVLEIPVDMRIVSKPLEPARRRRSPINKRIPWHPLHTFFAGDCVLDDAWEVGSRLASLFPRIEKMVIRNKSEKWRNMWDIYNEMVDVRYEEVVWRMRTGC